MPYPDPIANMFKNSGVKKMVANYEGTETVADTTYFDAKGNMARVVSPGSDISTAFDSLGWPTKILKWTHVPSNYVISYSFKSNRELVQTWRPLSSLAWEEVDVDTTNANGPTFKITYEIGPNGNVVSHWSERDGGITKYGYDSQSRLISKTTIDAEHGNIEIESWTYQYDNSSTVIEHRVRNKTRMRYYCSTLIDSAMFIEETKVKYTYVF
ncbi:MAG: YD repeat-containing protein [Chryseolinea sp.]